MIRPWFRQAAVPWKTTATQTRASGERIESPPNPGEWRLSRSRTDVWRGCWPGSSCCWCWITCEHVAGAVRTGCAPGLLAACDDVRVLAASREPLAVAGEARHRLGTS